MAPEITDASDGESTRTANNGTHTQVHFLLGKNENTMQMLIKHGPWK